MSNHNDLKKRRAPIDMSAEEFREAGHKLVDDIAAYIDSMRTRPVSFEEPPSQLDAVLPQELPEEGMDTLALLDSTQQSLYDHSLQSGTPKYFGYVMGSSAPIGMLGDLLAAAVNPNCGGWQIAQMAAQIELQTIKWIAEMLRYPVDAGGIFVSGGNMANMVAFLAARRAKTNWEVRSEGLRKGGQLLVYASQETHTWLQKAADLFGLGTDAIRWLPTDAQQRAVIDDLPAMIQKDRAAGHVPFLVVGSAGTVSTGAIDPLRDIAAVAGDHDLWFHIDGAYGAFAAMLDDVGDDMHAFALADSVAVDPHKWMYAPVEAGVTLVKDAAALPDAFSYRPPYYRFEAEDEPRVNFYERGLQNSRGFRALKVWMAIRQVGHGGYRKMIGQDCELSRAMYAAAEAHPELEARTQHLSIATFRYVPQDLTPGADKVETYLNELNEALLERIKTSGELFLSNAVLDGTMVLRACIVNFRTSLEDVEAVPDMVADIGRQLDAEMRPAL